MTSSYTTKSISLREGSDPRRAEIELLERSKRLNDLFLENHNNNHSC